MNKIININKNDESTLDAIRTESGVWVARIGNVRPDKDMTRELHLWLGRSPLHRREFKRLATLWVNLDVAAESALADIFDRLEERGAATATARRAVFAGMLLVIGVVSILGTWKLTPDYFQQPPYNVVYQTAIGEMRSLELPDQSLMQLNTRTKATVNYSGDARIIHLAEGEAQFEVSHDPDRPFIVYAGRHAVRAVGTAFSVYLTGEGSVDVIVSSGRIQVATFTDPAVSADTINWDSPETSKDIKDLMTFDSGHHAVFKDEIELVERIEAETIEKRLSWRNNIVAFNGDRLEDVVRELGRYTPKKFVILDEELRDFKVGAYFRAGDIVSILDTFDTGLGIHVQEAGENTVYLTKKH